MLKPLAIFVGIIACIIFPPFLVLVVPAAIAIYVISEKEERQRIHVAQMQHRAKLEDEVGKFFKS